MKTPHATSRSVAYGLALLLGIAVWSMGGLSSFDNLSTYATKHDWWWGPALPIGLDLAIPALLILDWLRPSVFLRTAAWGLTLSTVAANGGVAGGGYTDRLLHALMPALAILIVEAARHLRDDPRRMDRIRMSRWLLSPVRTVRLWRRMVLWEVTSYSEALARESAILHARTVLAAHYGQRSWFRTWRRVPLTLRHMLATGQLPPMVLHSLDVQTEVREWVHRALAEFAPNTVADPSEEARTEGADAEDPAPPVRSQWDLIWDLQDSLRPDGVPDETFAQAIGMARRHFEQVGAHMRNEDFAVRLSIAKGRANAIGKVLRTSYQAGADLGVPAKDSADITGGQQPGEWGPRVVLASPGGLNGVAFDSAAPSEGAQSDGGGS